MPTIAPFKQDNFAATAATRCIKLYVPDDSSYLHLVGGLLALAGDAANYQDPESVQAEGVAAVFRDAYIETDWEGCGSPPECQQMNSQLVIFPSLFIVTSGVAIAYAIDSAMELGGYWQQNPPATADQWRLEQYLAPGEWEIKVTYLRNTVNGKGNLYITNDFTNYPLNVNFDLRGATLRNARFTATFTIPDNGDLYTIGLDGTGASSGSSYFRPIQRIELWKYAP